MSNSYKNSIRGSIDFSVVRQFEFNFAKYFFVESDGECYGALEARVEARAPEKDVEILLGDCNDVIDKVKAPATGLGP
jgi:hypothetical protein